MSKKHRRSKQQTATILAALQICLEQAQAAQVTVSTPSVQAPVAEVCNG
jgi:hypothetical protein